MYCPSAELNSTKSTSCPAPVLQGMQVPGALAVKERCFLECFLTLVRIKEGTMYNNCYACLPTNAYPLALEGYPDRQEKGFRLLRAHPGCIWRARLWEAMQMSLAVSVTLAKFIDRSNLVQYAWYLRTTSIQSQNILWIKTLFKINKRSRWLINMKNDYLKMTPTLCWSTEALGIKQQQEDAHHTSLMNCC